MLLQVESLFSNEWLNEIGHQLGGYPKNDDLLSFDNSVGKFYIRSLPLGNGLVAVYWHLLLNEKVHLYHKPIENEEYYVAYFVEGANVPPHLEVINSIDFVHEKGIHIHSTKNGQLIRLAEGVNYQFLTLTLSKTFLEAALVVAPSAQVEQLFRENQAKYPYSNLSTDMQQMFARLNWVQFSAMQQFQATACCHWLLFLFLESLHESIVHPIYIQKPGDEFNRKSPQDIERIRLVEKTFFDDSQLPPMGTLAKQSGMSLTKFRELFKDVYGKPVYEYYKQKRMDKAQVLLGEGRSVSYVSATIGYAKINNFSKAFKDYFGFKPSASQQRTAELTKSNKHEQS
jgi:AraC-like DNA-binding protein